MKTIAVAALLLSLPGCGVSQAKYDAALRSADGAHADTHRTAEAYEQKLARCSQDVATRDQTLAAREGRLVECQDATRALQSNLDAMTATDEQMKRAHEMAEARAAMYRQIALRLKSMVDAHELAIVLRDGRMVLRLPNDVLFDSGSTMVKPAGLKALAQIATALKVDPDRHLQVAGHTDDVPINTERYASNWELSTQRAIEVVRVLIKGGLRPTALSAAGYGEFDPISPNESAVGRQRNRRIEITVQPQIDEFVTVPRF